MQIYNDKQFEELENNTNRQSKSFAIHFISVALILSIEYCFCNYIIYNFQIIMENKVSLATIQILQSISVQVLNVVVNVMLQTYYDTKFKDEFYALPFRICFTVNNI